MAYKQNILTMKIEGKNYQTIWMDKDSPGIVKVIDQQKLPFFFEIKELRTVEDVYAAIKNMTVRGAPLIGAAGAFGIYLATLDPVYSNKGYPEEAARYLISSRPTAVNLSWAVNFVMNLLALNRSEEMASGIALKAALEICETEKENCRQIGLHGLKIIEKLSRKKKGKPVNILTHCNAGWLACIDYGTATAPVYLAHDKGIPVHVWVDETRPGNQGARLTAFELGNYGVPYTLITDNCGGHLMQQKEVDVVIVGSDRTARNGDSANKIGTYLKALAARDNKIPYYVAVPSTSIDINIDNGLKDIPVELRPQEEVTTVTGLAGGKIQKVRICPDDAVAVNWSFDITPARLITGLITEKGICRADEKEIINLFKDK